jgi:adenine/guanine phosphoribosyltransferase-like PRPP-binding protein
MVEVEAKIQQNNLIRLKDDLLNWIKAKEGDDVIIIDDTNKRGQRFLAIWKKGT